MNWHEIILNPNENFHLFFIESNALGSNCDWGFSVNEIRLENVRPMLPSGISITYNTGSHCLRYSPDVPEARKALPLIWAAIAAKQQMWGAALAVA